MSFQQVFEQIYPRYCLNYHGQCLDLLYTWHLISMKVGFSDVACVFTAEREIHISLTAKMRGAQLFEHAHLYKRIQYPSQECWNGQDNRRETIHQQIMLHWQISHIWTNAMTYQMSLRSAFQHHNYDEGYIYR